MVIALTGGSGFFGRYIANDLLAARDVEQQYSGDVASRIHSLREKLDQNIQGQD